jgi:hypothetical protein
MRVLAVLSPVLGVETSHGVEMKEGICYHQFASMEVTEFDMNERSGLIFTCAEAREQGAAPKRRRTC